MDARNVDFLEMSS